MMKNVLKLALGLLLVLSVLSCKKEVSVSNLNGTWELRYLVGGQIATASPNYEPGNGNRIIFKQQKFERYDDGRLVESGTFTLTPEKAKVNNEVANFSLITDNNLKQYIKLSPKDLVIFTGVVAADGTEAHYVKL
jgi:hypothetical protein